MTTEGARERTPLPNPEHASARETLKRIPVINDPAISDAMAALEEQMGEVHGATDARAGREVDLDAASRESTGVLRAWIKHFEQVFGAPQKEWPVDTRREIVIGITSREGMMFRAGYLAALDRQEKRVVVLEGALKWRIELDAQRIAETWPGDTPSALKTQALAELAHLCAALAGHEEVV